MRHADDCTSRDDERECDCSPTLLRARVAELEKALRLVLASATPDDFHHRTMSAAWRHATNVLEKR